MLSSEEKSIYEWQFDVFGHGQKGQERLKNSTVLISRCGGLGSVVAYELAAAGVGKLILAHGGTIKHSDLNRQLLMNYSALGKTRVTTATQRLKTFNPHIEIIPIAENINEKNVMDLVAMADLVVDAAPLFTERFLLNKEIVAQNKPMVDCAMYELQAQITTIIPQKTPCLSCLYPEIPPQWRRKFPVFGAVSGTIACLGAMEAIKYLSGFGEYLAGRLLTFDMRTMTTQTLSISRRKNCPVCYS